ALAAEAARAHLKADSGAGLSLRGLAWTRPLAPADLAPDSAQVRVERRKDDLGLPLHLHLEARRRDGAWAEFAAAQVRPLTPGDAAPPPLDAAARAALEAACPEALPVAPASQGSGPVGVSPRWDRLRTARRSADGRRLLARLDAPRGDGPGPHPALLDAALSLALADGPVRLPSACAEFQIFAPLSGAVLAVIDRRDLPDGRLGVDAVLYAEADGAPLVRATSLVFSPPPGPALRYPAWEPRPLAETADSEVKTEAASAPTALWAPGMDAAAAAALGAALNVGDGLLETAADPDPEALAQDWDPAARLVALLGTEPPDADPEPAAERLAWLLRALAARPGTRTRRVLVLGRGAFAADGGESVLRPGQALAAGLCLSLPFEEPRLDCRFLDLDPNLDLNAQLDAVRAELADPAPLHGPDRLAALRHGTRLARTLAAAPPGELRPAEPRPDGCWVVTGGFGGMGLTLARALAGQPGARLALLGRTAEPPAGDDPEAARRRELWAGLAASGARVLPLAADVTHRPSLRAALDRARAELGPIHGVLHCAGAPGDGFLVRKTRAEFRRTLAPKVAGARLLDELTRQDPVECFVLAASRTGLGGAPGQTDYTAANAWLDAFAAWRRSQGRPALALDWPAWREVGMARRLGGETPVGPSIAPADAPGLLLAALRAGAAQACPLAPEPVPDGAPEAGTPAAPPPPADAGTEFEVRLTAEPPRTFSAAERAVGRIWGNVLGYRELPVDEDFHALGGDSIVGMGLVNRLNRELSAGLTLADLFATGTVAGLAALIGPNPAGTPEERTDGQTAGHEDGHEDGPAADAAPAAPGAVPLPPAPPGPDAPVSLAQASVLRAERSGTAGTGYNLPQFYLLPHGADPARLQTALDALLRRHEVLRTRFITRDGRPRMVVEPETRLSHVPLEVLDLAPDAFEARAAALIRPFDPARAPLLRAALLRTPEPGQDHGRQILFLDTHHAVGDAMTLEILAADLAALYDRPDAPPPAPARTLRDYAVWERDFLRRGGGKGVQDWWRELWRDGLPVLELPADAPRPARFTARGAGLPLPQDPDLAPAVRAQARRLRTSPFILTLAALAVTAARHAGGGPLCISMADNGRILPETETMPGMFSRTLPLRAEVRPGDDVAGLTARLTRIHHGALAHRLLDEDGLMDELAPARPDHQPMSDLTVSYMNFADGAYGGGGLALRPLGSGRKDSCKG
ncbi:MAG: SDR family NAD(P)-dependent oxidoreductase, partial [Desulfovibrionaceae bacterium]